MLDLILAAALLQPAAACNAIEPAGPRPANCPAWEQLASTPEATTLVDHASVQRDGAAFDIALRTVFPADGEGGMRSVNSRMRLDCGARTAVVRFLTAFDARGGEIMSGAPSGEMAVPRPVPPGAPPEALLTRHCAR